MGTKQAAIDAAKAATAAAASTGKTFEDLIADVQTAIEIELATIPIYLYTYYSINKYPENTDAKTSQYAQMAGGLIMSVAIEEMLHMALSSNLKRSLGEAPQVAGKSPDFPSPLPKHAGDHDFNLSPLTLAQLNDMLLIEQPSTSEDKPTDTDWVTLAQFYDEIKLMLADPKVMKGHDYGWADLQLGPNHGYYVPNNADSTYHDTDGNVKYPNDPNYNPHATPTKDPDRGDVMIIDNIETAYQAIDLIIHEGEGSGDEHEWESDDHKEWSHWYKFHQLHDGFADVDSQAFVRDLPLNPKYTDYGTGLRELGELIAATYTYLYVMMEGCYRNPVPKQTAIFNFGMHKGMIFILDRLCGHIVSFPEIDANGNETGKTAGPPFQNYDFSQRPGLSPKQQMEMILETISIKYRPSNYDEIHQRISDLPDIPYVV